ncbi:MAG: hypothetical protein AAGA30_12035, partial [Planctomycetota bacterium]
MDNLDQVIVVLPCHGLEDFPTHETGDVASSLLSNWTASWHPSLIAATGQMPDWVSKDFIHQKIENALVFLPQNVHADVPPEIVEAEASGLATIISGAVTRSEICDLTQYQKYVDEQIDDAFVADFFALGYAYLQIQLMTRQLRYSSTLNTEEFQSRLVRAATHLVAGEAELQRQQLSGCFDLLLEERNNFYPTHPFLAKLALTPEVNHSWQQAIEKELRDEQKLNILLDSDQLNEIDQKVPKF